MVLLNFSWTLLLVFFAMEMHIFLWSPWQCSNIFPFQVRRRQNLKGLAIWIWVMETNNLSCKRKIKDILSKKVGTLYWSFGLMTSFLLHYETFCQQQIETNIRLIVSNISFTIHKILLMLIKSFLLGFL